MRLYGEIIHEFKLGELSLRNGAQTMLFVSLRTNSFSDFAADLQESCRGSPFTINRITLVRSETIWVAGIGLRKMP